MAIQQRKARGKEVYYFTESAGRRTASQRQWTVLSSRRKTRDTRRVAVLSRFSPARWTRVLLVRDGAAASDYVYGMALVFWLMWRSYCTWHTVHARHAFLRSVHQLQPKSSPPSNVCRKIRFAVLRHILACRRVAKLGKSVDAKFDRILK